MLVTSIFSFSCNLFYSSQTNFDSKVTLTLSSANAFNFDQSKNVSFGKYFKQCGLLTLLKQKALKTLSKKQKMLMTENFCFSHNVFYPITDKFNILNKIYVVVCKCCPFQAKSLSSNKELTSMNKIINLDMVNPFPNDKL